MKEPFANNREDYIINLLDLSKKDNVLIIGVSNIPTLEKRIQNLAKECWILDLDNIKLEKAGKILNKSKLINADITKKINLPNNHFTKIMILEVLEHLDDDKGALIKLNKLLHPKGSLIIAVPNKSFLHIFNPLLYTQHKRHYCNDKIIELLKETGFSIKHFNVVENWSMFFNLYLHLFYKFILNRNKKFLTLEKIPGNTYRQFNK